MKASELRIGNWYLDLSNNPKQWEFSRNDYDFYSPEELEKLQGIPLTEEWMVKFGFEKTTYGYESRMPTIEFDFIQINTGVKIRYVHQLQNLYFALTGEELTIK